MSCVHYKFSSKLNYDTITFDGLHISLCDLKKQIMGREKLKAADCDLQITNAQTDEEYTDDAALIPKNSSVIVRRIPIGGVKTASKTYVLTRAEPAIGPAKAIDDSSSSISLAQLSKTANLAEANASEEDKIKAMMSQSGQDYDPANYMKKTLGPPPPTYTCFRCLKPGHYIKNCPTNTDKNFEAATRIKKSTGIPRSFMMEVNDPNMRGAMLTNTGRYAIPTIDAEAYAIGKKEKPPFLPEVPSSSSEEDDPIPDELLCLICKDIMADAVVIPCCGNSYCDECIRTSLLESEEHTCPTCHQTDVSPDALIANKFLRQAVNNFKNETGYTKRLRKPPVQSQAKPLIARTMQTAERVTTSRQQDPLMVSVTTTSASVSAPITVPVVSSVSQTTVANTITTAMHGSHSTATVCAANTSTAVPATLKSEILEGIESNELKTTVLNTAVTSTACSSTSTTAVSEQKVYPVSLLGQPASHMHQVSHTQAGSPTHGQPTTQAQLVSQGQSTSHLQPATHAQPAPHGQLAPHAQPPPLVQTALHAQPALAQPAPHAQPPPLGQPTPHVQPAAHVQPVLHGQTAPHVQPPHGQPAPHMQPAPYGQSLQMPGPPLRTNSVRPPGNRSGWEPATGRGCPQNDRPTRTQTQTLPTSTPVFVPPPLYPPHPHGIPLPAGVPPPQFPPQFPPGQPPPSNFPVPPPGFPPAPTNITTPWVGPATQPAPHTSTMPTIAPQAPPLSREEFYREQRRLKEEEKKKSKLDEFTNDFAKELMEYRKIQKERRRSYSR